MIIDLILAELLETFEINAAVGDLRNTFFSYRFFS